MHKWKKYILIMVLLLFFFSIFFVRSLTLNQQMTFWLNQKFSESGWKLDFEESTGTLSGTTNLNNVTLNHISGSSVKIENLSFNIGLISSMINMPNIVFDLITIEGLNTFYSTEENFSKDRNYKTLNELPFYVNTFFVDGQVTTNLNGNNLVLNILLGGAINGEKNTELNFDLFKISIDGNPNLFLHFDQLTLGEDGDLYFLQDINGYFINLPINGDIYYDKISRMLKGTVDLMNFSIPEEMFAKLPLQTKFSTFNGVFNFKSDLQSFDGEINLNNKLGLEMNGQFSFQKYLDKWILDNLILTGEKSKLEMNGTLHAGHSFSCFMNLENFDLSRWVKNQKSTKMSGLFIMDAALDENMVLDQINMTLEMVEEKLFEQGEISIHGLLNYNDSTLSTISPVMFLIGDSYLTINGEGDFKSRTMDILLDLEKADIELVNNFLPGDFITGKATGRLKVIGDFFSPSVISELMCDNIIINDFYLERIELNSKMFVNDSLLTGYIDMKSGKGFWKERTFESGTIYGIFDNQSVIIENCHFKSGKDFLQISGKFDGISIYNIDQIQFAYNNNYLINAKPISFSLNESNFKVEPFELHINDGMMEGVINGGDNIEGTFKMSNFDTEVLSQFIKDDRLKISGLVFGEIWIESNNNNIDLDVDLSFKKGIYMEEKFDEMIISGLYKNGILHLDDIAMTREGAIGLQMNGIIPIENHNLNHTIISMDADFTNLPLKFLHRFIPKFFEIGGNATGNIRLNGTPDKTRFSYKLAIDKPQFDLVQMDYLISNGLYDGKRLKIANAESINKNGSIKSSGYVPFDLNIGSSQFGSFFINDSINLTTYADINSLPFLTPYLTDLDSAYGNYKIDLLVNGPIDNLRRNGKIIVQDAILYTQLLNDPIRFINGEGQLINNELKISNFFAGLHYDNGTYLKKNNQNTNISGSIDFSKFFNPGYNLRVISDEASFKLLDLDIDGMADLDITVIGKDTVEIKGLIEAKDVNIFYEFSTEDIGSAIQENKNTVMAYNLNIPIKNKAFFQNSQIDAEVTGEINLSQVGNQEIDFGGQIFVEKGNFFSHKDNFESLNGIVNFDNNGFNPTIDLSAHTMIDNERIDLKMIGDIDDPDVVLESASGFSESDILELLTWGKRFEDQEGTSTGFGNQTVSFLGALLETQLEKNIKESNIGMINYFDDINITGAAGLLQGSDDNFKLAAKKRIGNKTFLNLSYKRSFSLNDQSQLGVEYKLNRHFSVVANLDKDGNYNVKYRYKYAY
ncbi:MAG: hypothetical protein CMG55_02470 [Candidatus Marinimicrobia bacterium]|nr:hypothetical protein [Candidatus Neomarinimicrobiota bacterium]